MIDAIRLDPLARTLPAAVNRAAATWGESLLCRYPDADVSFIDAHRRMRGAAGALQRLGVEHGDRVTILMENRSEWIDAWFGTCAIGAIEVPVNHGLKGRLLAHCIADSGSTTAFVEDRFLDEVLRNRHRMPELQTVIVVGERPEPAEGIELVAIDDLPFSEPDLPELRWGGPAGIMYTSGTTGSAKGVVLPHNYFLHFGEQKAKHLRTSERDRIYNCYPMFNATGQCETTMVALVTGASVVHAPRFSASRFWEDIRSSGCTEFVYMGGILSILAKAEPQAGDPDNPIRAGYGVPTPADLHPVFEERFGCVLVEVYGSTEANAVTFNPYDDRKWGSCGLPTAGFDIRVVDDDDIEVGPDELGEVIVRPTVPHSMMLGYWNLPDKTSEAFAGLWYRTGDLVRRDADGYLFFCGRRSEAIRHRGYMIDAADIEVVLNDDPAVLESCVVALPDSERGEDDIKAFVVPRDADVDVDALLDRCIVELPLWMIPRYWEVRGELPKTPTQRVEKYMLRQEGITATTLDRADAIAQARRASRG